jgi:large subunit ribosomal protein L14
MIKIADNTGAKLVQCFRVLGGSARRYAGIGDIVVASVKEAEPAKPVKKHEVVRAVIIRTRFPMRRPDGSYVTFDENAAVILEKGKEPKGSRIFAPVPRELKDMGYDKIASLAEELV